MNLNIRVALGLLLVPFLALSLTGCADMEVEDQGELPEVQMDGGELPEPETDETDVDTDTQQQEMTTPETEADADQTEPPVPELDLEVPQENPQQDN
jgi:hypothetical protein